MRAEKFSGYEGLKLVDLPKPAVSDGKVLLRMTAAGVTPLDHTILSGQFPLAKAPLVLGNEGAGLTQPVSWIVADIVRMEDGILVEHWDVIQDEAAQEQSKSGLPMFGEKFPNI
jgi:D-arabinose 1-dehydrogenase-like Zn-dependent alcohol dehydrogenase